MVLFAHGSRDPNWRAPFERLRREVADSMGEESVRLAYLEFEPPGLDEVLAEASVDRIQRVVILPLFIAAFLIVWGRTPWWFALIYAALGWAFLYFMFDRTIAVVWHPSLLFF